MEPDNSVIAAVEAAVAADPGNSALRLHLATLLSAAGRPHDSLGNVEIILRDQPDDVDALRLAVQVGEALGDSRAPVWSRLLKLLSDETAIDTEDSSETVTSTGKTTEPAPQRARSQEGDSTSPG